MTYYSAVLVICCIWCHQWLVWLAVGIKPGSSGWNLPVILATELLTHGSVGRFINQYFGNACSWISEWIKCITVHCIGGHCRNETAHLARALITNINSICCCRFIRFKMASSFILLQSWLEYFADCSGTARASGLNKFLIPFSIIPKGFPLKTGDRRDLIWQLSQFFSGK